MRTDSIFYQFFQLLPELLGELLQDTSTANYAFASVEIKELARRIDGVFVPLSQEKEQRLYFVEVQFQSDDQLYERLITESILYLSQYRPSHRWKAVAIWAKSSLDGGIPLYYEDFQRAGLLRVIYLDSLPNQDSLGLNLLSLVTAKPEQVTETLNLLSQNISNLEDETFERQIIELVEKVLVYKFPNLTPEDLAAMFGQQELEQTRFYQEVLKRGEVLGEKRGEIRGKLKSVPNLMKLGLSPEQIAEALELDLALVQQAVNEAESS